MSELGELGEQLHTLKAREAHLHNPVRFRFIEALHERAQGLPDKAAALVLAKAKSALKQYQNELGKQANEQAPVNEPAIAQLQALTQALSNKESAAAVEQEDSLNRLLLQQEQEILAKSTLSSGLKGQPAHRPQELKSLNGFRAAWEKHRAQRMAIAVNNEAPENPGPLNQHMLVISTLTKMQALSPAYFSRFVSYMGSMMWLQDAAQEHKSDKKT